MAASRDRFPVWYVSSTRLPVSRAIFAPSRCASNELAGSVSNLMWPYATSAQQMSAGFSVTRSAWRRGFRGLYASSWAPVMANVIGHDRGPR